MNCEKAVLNLRCCAPSQRTTSSPQASNRRRSKSDRPSSGKPSVQGQRRQHDRIDGLARGRPGALKIDAADIVAGEIARQAVSNKARRKFRLVIAKSYDAGRASARRERLQNPP